MLQHSSGNRLLHAAHCTLLHVGQPIAKVLQIIKAPRRGGKLRVGCKLQVCALDLGASNQLLPAG